MSLLALFIGSIFVNNILLSRFLGCCPFLGVSSKLETAKGMGIAVVFVIVLASTMTWLAYTFILVPLGLEYLYTLSFILIIAALVQFVEIVLKKVQPGLYKSLGIFLPLITTNCAVLGVTMININNGLTFGESIVNALGGGLGFTLALVMFSGVRSRLETCDIPQTFKGVPSTLIAASIVSVSFMGFAGLIEGIFH